MPQLSRFTSYVTVRYGIATATGKGHAGREEHLAFEKPDDGPSVRADVDIGNLPQVVECANMSMDSQLHVWSKR